MLYEAGIDFLKYIGYVPWYAFYKSNIQTIDIPSNITSIGNSAFYGCSNLTSIEISSGVMNIGWSAFSGCSGLTSIKIPSSVTSIGGGAFLDCGKLEIKYDGTVDEWVNLIGNNSTVFKNTTYICNCIDGVVKE